MRPIAWGAPGWESVDPPRAQKYSDDLARLSMAKARTRIVEQLREAADLVGEPRPITHPVKFFEKGDRPLEIITSRQWFIKTIEFRDALLARGRSLRWHPQYMLARFENWANGLNGDWCVSRQRFFGVPFPVWYPIASDGTIKHSEPIVPGEDQLRELHAVEDHLAHLAPELERRVHRIARTAWDVLGLAGYARVDRVVSSLPWAIWRGPWRLTCRRPIFASSRLRRCRSLPNPSMS